MVGFGAQNPQVQDMETGLTGRKNISRNLKENFLVDRSDEMAACRKYDTIICANNLDNEASSCFGNFSMLNKKNLINFQS